PSNENSSGADDRTKLIRNEAATFLTIIAFERQRVVVFRVTRGIGVPYDEQRRVGILRVIGSELLEARVRQEEGLVELKMSSAKAQQDDLRMEDERVHRIVAQPLPYQLPSRAA